MAVTRAVHTLLSGAPLSFQLQQPFVWWHRHPLAVHMVLSGARLSSSYSGPLFGGTATPWRCTAMPRAVPPLAVSSRFFVEASSSLRLGLLASLLGCQHLLQCLLLSVDHFLHVPKLIQVRVASY